jgi:hypothetical protein
LKELKRNGRSHTGPDVVPQPGSEAIFCAGCPQADKNLDQGWRNDPEIWKYTVSLTADGNFTLVHRASQTSKDDVWLKRGEGYLVEKGRYAAHLAVSKDHKQVFHPSVYSLSTSPIKYHSYRNLHATSIVQSKISTRFTTRDAMSPE